MSVGSVKGSASSAGVSIAGAGWGLNFFSFFCLASCCFLWRRISRQLWNRAQRPAKYPIGPANQTASIRTEKVETM